MTTDDLDLDLARYDADVTEHALFAAARTRMLDDVIGGQPWDVDLGAGRGTFGGVAYTLQILGTHAPDDTFVWAWGNAGAAGWGPSLEMATKLRRLGETRGYAVFRERKIAGAWVPFRELAWVSGELAGGVPVHFASAGPETTVILALTSANLDPLEMPTAYLAGVLLDAQAEIAAPVLPAVERFLERLGFSVRTAAGVVEARREDGTELHVAFDDDGRVTDVGGHLVPRDRR